MTALALTAIRSLLVALLLATGMLAAAQEEQNGPTIDTEVDPRDDAAIEQRLRAIFTEIEGPGVIAL